MSNELGFALKPRNLDEAVKMAEMLTRSSMVPNVYKNKPQDALVAMIMGSELGLNPVQALQNIAVINGRPSIYGDALAALAQNHPHFGGMEESFDDETMTATCTVWRKGGTKHTQKFSQADAQKAGLIGKTGPWSCYPKRMLSLRARGFALRSQFADALCGLITREEAEDMPEGKFITRMAGQDYIDSTREYLDYIEEHLNNVAKAFSELSDACDGKEHWVVDDYSWHTLHHDVINHDLSKFSKEEFVQYRDNFFPVNDSDKENSGFLLAWENHKSKNHHHHETAENYHDLIHMIVDFMAMSYKFKNNPRCFYEKTKQKMDLKPEFHKFISKQFDHLESYRNR